MYIIPYTIIRFKTEIIKKSKSSHEINKYQIIKWVEEFKRREALLRVMICDKKKKKKVLVKDKDNFIK